MDDSDKTKFDSAKPFLKEGFFCNGYYILELLGAKLLAENPSLFLMSGSARVISDNQCLLLAMMHHAHGFYNVHRPNIKGVPAFGADVIDKYKWFMGLAKKGFLMNATNKGLAEKYEEFRRVLPGASVGKEWSVFVGLVANPVAFKTAIVTEPKGLLKEVIKEPAPAKGGSLTVFWTRHAMSCANVLKELGEKGKRSNYALNSSLADIGIEQCMQFRDTINKEIRSTLDFVGASALLRAQQTAALLYNPEIVYVLPYISEKRVLLLPDDDNKPMPETKNKSMFDTFKDYLKPKSVITTNLNYTFRSMFDIEEKKAFQVKADPLLILPKIYEHLSNKNSEKKDFTIAIVSHQGWLKDAGITPTKTKLMNCGIIRNTYTINGTTIKSGISTVVFPKEGNSPSIQVNEVQISFIPKIQPPLINVIQSNFVGICDAIHPGYISSIQKIIPKSDLVLTGGNMVYNKEFPGQLINFPNVGSSCFFDSGLQLLRNIPELFNTAHINIPDKYIKPTTSIYDFLQKYHRNISFSSIQSDAIQTWRSTYENDVDKMYNICRLAIEQQDDADLFLQQLTSDNIIESTIQSIVGCMIDMKRLLKCDETKEIFSSVSSIKPYYVFDIKDIDNSRPIEPTILFSTIQRNWTKMDEYKINDDDKTKYGCTDDNQYYADYTRLYDTKPYVIFTVPYSFQKPFENKKGEFKTLLSSSLQSLRAMFDGKSEQDENKYINHIFEFSNKISVNEGMISSLYASLGVLPNTLYHSTIRGNKPAIDAIGYATFQRNTTFSNFHSTIQFEDKQYQPLSVVYKSGGAGGGHYVCANRFGSNWVLYNDMQFNDHKYGEPCVIQDNGGLNNDTNRFIRMILFGSPAGVTPVPSKPAAAETLVTEVSSLVDEIPNFLLSETPASQKGGSLTVFWTRHALSCANLLKEMSAFKTARSSLAPNSSLSDIGIKQCSTYRDTLLSIRDDLDMVCASPLQRAYQTAALLYGPKIKRTGQHSDNEETLEPIYVLPYISESYPKLMPFQDDNKPDSSSENTGKFINFKEYVNRNVKHTKNWIVPVNLELAYTYKIDSKNDKTTLYNINETQAWNVQPDLSKTDLLAKLYQHLKDKHKDKREFKIAIVGHGIWLSESGIKGRAGIKGDVPNCGTIQETYTFSDASAYKITETRQIFPKPNENLPPITIDGTEFAFTIPLAPQIQGYLNNDKDSDALIGLCAKMEPRKTGNPVKNTNFSQRFTKKQKRSFQNSVKSVAHTVSQKLSPVGKTLKRGKNTVVTVTAAVTTAAKRITQKAKSLIKFDERKAAAEKKNQEIKDKTEASTARANLMTINTQLEKLGENDTSKKLLIFSNNNKNSKYTNITNIINAMKKYKDDTDIALLEYITGHITMCINKIEGWIARTSRPKVEYTEYIENLKELNTVILSYN